FRWPLGVLLLGSCLLGLGEHEAALPRGRPPEATVAAFLAANASADQCLLVPTPSDVHRFRCYVTAAGDRGPRIACWSPPPPASQPKHYGENAHWPLLDPQRDFWAAPRQDHRRPLHVWIFDQHL